MFLTDQNSQGKEAGMERKRAFTAVFCCVFYFFVLWGVAVAVSIEDAAKAGKF